MSDHTPFVGRKSELAELDAALSQAQGGVGCFVLVAEPGIIGKTTLCTSLSRSESGRIREVWWCGKKA